MPQALHLMSTLAVEVALKRVILPAWQADGHDIEVDWAPTTLLQQKIRDGARGDVVILIDAPMAELVALEIVEPKSVTSIAQARLGLAACKGASLPRIDDVPAFQAAILAARSVAYSRSGASGLYFAELIDRLGIAGEVNAKATRIPAGFTAEKLITGEADLAVQQISELMAIDGIDIVGPFPEPLQQPTDFSAAIFKKAARPQEAQAFLDLLSGTIAHDAYEAFGLTSRLKPQNG